MKSYKIGVIKGDGIGPEIIDEAIKVLDAVSVSEGFNLKYEEMLLGGAAIDETGVPLPDETIQGVKKCDAVLFGAIGGPKWDTLERHLRPESGLLGLRKEMGTFANLRPAMVYDELVNASSLKPAVIQGVDIMVVRELTGGIYFGQPREYDANKSYNTMVYTREEVERIAVVAFDIAMKRDKRICSVDKANVLEVSQFWREIVEEVAKDYPEVELTHMYVDNAAMQLIRDPKQFDVILTGNIFGDILSDAASMLSGSIGLLPSASTGKGVGLFEPIHGSAPDIAGQGIANPLATISSASMMLRYALGEATAADKIDDAIKKDDTFARVGGDKFAILISSIDKNEDETKEYVNNYIRAVKNRFLEPLKIAGDDNLLSFSIGIMMFNNDEQSAFDILKKSETAMYATKDSARGTATYYEHGMDDFEKEKFSIANDIHKALLNDEFHMVYQPQIDIKSGKIVSVESLIRWNHPTKGEISPTIFIPIAEESGTIIDVENWTYNRVFSEMHALKDDEGNFILERVAVNVSTVHFMQSNFIEKFTMIALKYNIDPTRIELEITEGGVMRNIDEAVKKIKELKEFGFTFAIDDFGTGYSSLAYLKKLPVDMIKIDKSFIDNIHTHKEDAAIINSVIYIGDKFGFKVLSEGVEEKEVLDDLKDMGCDLYQGYYGYKPMIMNKLTSVLQEQS